MTLGAFVGSRFLQVLRPLALCCVGFLFLAESPEAQTKRLNNRFANLANELAKDREEAFHGGRGMAIEDFQERWTQFADQLDQDYQGFRITLRTFGTDVRLRNIFTHLTYLALRTHQRNPLAPPPAELIARHPFLQDLVVEGSCYTGGDPFPKRMRDLLRAYPDILVAMREHLEDWDKENRANFIKEFNNNSN